ncbi:NAD(P)-binding protein, partial [Bifidobacterium mongoliense]
MVGGRVGVGDASDKADVLDGVDLVVVGAGLYGLTVAQQAAERARARVLVIDVRGHIGG